ncbi:Dihydrofolate reductase [Buchnera aphidicola (Tetraneura ulmi)]|uniref:type 3 dihydrofolate reductase n=1 Tax=Buchnera aphidicola TaxID=9 RepID=UPI0034641E0A
MFISIIAAMSRNYVIGKNKKLPWNTIPNDLKWFKKNTINKSIIMGRKTWDSLKNPLPMRQNIIISRNITTKKNTKNIFWVNSFIKAIQAAKNKKEIMIIGGGNVYKQSLKYANRLYLTHINKKIEGDTYFPKYNNLLWKRIYYKKYKNLINLKLFKYNFEILEKIKK